jgi:hypothetical protein
VSGREFAGPYAVRFVVIGNWRARPGMNIRPYVVCFVFGLGKMVSFVQMIQEVI